MSVQDTIIAKLQTAFAPLYMEVLNESHMHSGPRDAQTHFKVTMVSSAFDALRKVPRHQKVYAELQHELNTGVHALALHLYTQQEWQDREQQSPKSPNCMGGSKHDKNAGAN